MSTLLGSSVRSRIMDEPLENLYFNWLCAKVLYLEVHSPSTTYWKLFRRLFSTEYVWLLVGDDNRAMDGIELREEFLFESGFERDEGWEHFECSVFEMLLALSRRAEFQARRTVSWWFWHFLRNLGLEEQCDSVFDIDYVDAVLYKFVWRQYNAVGQGGLFPLSETNHDQTKVEVWYQFFAYLEDQELTA
jgi:hypothetical protein